MDAGAAPHRAAGYSERWANEFVMTHKLALAIALMLTSTACSPMYLAARPPVDISGYQGDGTIVRLKHPINPGFKIDFPSFMLDVPYSTSLRLDRLPKPRHHSPYEIGLVVDLSAEELSRWPEVPAWLKRSAMGSIILNVETQTGQPLLNLEAPLAGQSWIRRIDEPRLFAVLRVGSDSNLRAARFPSELESDQVPSVLKISYTPGADSPSKAASMRLEAGGED